MSIIREFTLYLHAGITTPEVIHANQYSQGETWIFKLLQDDGSVYVPSTGALIGVKADGHAIAGLTGTVLGDGRVSITTTQQLTAAAGDAICELTIDGGSNGSANFVIRVEKKPTDDAILSESDLSIIQEGLNSVTPAAIEEKVSDWLEENFTEPPVDPTLSISNAAADAKVTGDKLTELKTKITNSTAFDIARYIEWVKKTVNSSGNLVASNTVIISADYLPKSCGYAKTYIGRKVALYAWDASNAFIGIWNGSSFTSTVTFYRELDVGSVIAAYPTYNYRLTFSRSDNTAIDLSEVNQLSIINNVSVGTVKDLKAANAVNLYPNYGNNLSVTTKGVTIAFDKGKITAVGTPTSTFEYEVPFAPPAFEIGKLYYVHFSDVAVNGVFFRITENGNTVVETATNWYAKFTSEGATISIRVLFVSGTAINASFYPSISEAPTNHYLGEKMLSYLPVKFPAMLTIIDDDGHQNFYNDILPIIRNKGVTITSAIPAVKIGTNYMTAEQAMECYLGGAEIISHGYDHYDSETMQAMTEYEIENSYIKGRNYWLSKGVTGGRFLAYNGGTGNIAKVKRSAEKVFDLAIHSAGSARNNPQTIDLYKISRYSINNSDFAGGDIRQMVTDCINNGGWMIWMLHTSASDWSSTYASDLADLIDDIITVGLPIVSVDYVWNKYLKWMK